MPDEHVEIALIATDIILSQYSAEELGMRPAILFAQAIWSE